MARQKYHLSVFVNCPFDNKYRKLFQAIIFTIYDCGFVARSALEEDDSSTNRLDKILAIIRSSRLGIHDISRTQLESGTKLPRFNMPLELGMFLAAKKFGQGNQKQKKCLILDKELHRYLSFVSDIRGQDIKAHNNDVRKIIKHVRDWLNNDVPNNKILPGQKRISSRFSKFLKIFPNITNELGLDRNEIQFNDFSSLVSEWIKNNPK